MNILHDIKQTILIALAAELDAEGPEALASRTTAAITVSIPPHADHGDLATNAAMVAAKTAGVKPRTLAEGLARRLAAHPDIADVNVAGPGFVNLALAPSVWARLIWAIRNAPWSYGASRAHADKTVNVEYVSANPTGPLTIAHARGAVVGDAIANLLSETGHTVIRDYYVNDAGAQMKTLAESLRLRLRELEGEAIGPIPEGYYPGAYVKDLAAAASRAGVDSSWSTEALATIATQLMLETIRADLHALGVHHDTFVSEAALAATHQLDTAIDVLATKDLAYRGTLPPPKDADPETWVAEEQLLFKSTAYGDDVDRTLIKADGTATYFAGDLTYHRDKIARGFDLLIDVMGVDHAGYVKRLQGVVDALSSGNTALEVPLVSLVNLMRDGQPVKMSKRSGDFITLREVIDEVGADAVRFIMLTRKPETPLDFDLAEVVREQKDNPLYYVQYAHARCCSLERKASEILPALTIPPVDADALATYASQADMDLLKQVARFPQTLLDAADAREPHRIVGYLNDLAAAFHQHWTDGAHDPSKRILVESDPECTAFRLALARCVRTTLARGLSLVGVTPLDRMAQDR